MRAWLSSVLTLTGLISSSTAHSQSQADRAAIQAIVQDEQDAWNRGDAHSFAAHFAPDGSFTNIIGMQTYGVEPFFQQHQHIFSTIYKGSHNELKLGKTRFIRPDVAVADVDSTLSHFVSVPPGTPLGSDGAVHTRLQLVLSKDNGTWQIQAFHNVVLNEALASAPPR